MNAESWSMAVGLDIAYTQGRIMDVIYSPPSQNNITMTARCDILRTAVTRCGTSLCPTVILQGSTWSDVALASSPDNCYWRPGP